MERREAALARFSLRMPKDVHDRIKQKADYAFHSMNAEMVRLLEVAIKAEEAPATGANLGRYTPEAGSDHVNPER